MAIFFFIQILFVYTDNSVDLCRYDSINIIIEIILL
jgi:hypothetical protein